MEEKIIIQGKSKDLSTSVLFYIISVILLVLTWILFSVGCGVCCALEGILFSSPILVLIVIFVIICLAIKNCAITVTDKRVYGKSLFGKRVDLPIDSVSAIGTSIFKGIDIGTSSGKIKFKLITNNDEIHSVMSTQIINRQANKNSNPINLNTCNADELKKFKELLDSGVITQEEFDAKKKQLLGL